jgi:DNA-binding IscR family transcriptional regulator
MQKSDKVLHALRAMAIGQWARVPDVARMAGCTTVYAHVVIKELETRGVVSVHRGSEEVGARIRPVNYVMMGRGHQ